MIVQLEGGPGLIIALGMLVEPSTPVPSTSLPKGELAEQLIKLLDDETLHVGESDFRITDVWVYEPSEPVKPPPR